MRLVNRKSSTIPFLQDDEDGIDIESNIDKANVLNSFFHRCFNYDFPPLTDALEPNLPAENCPKQLLSTEESVYDMLTTLNTYKQVNRM